MRVSFVTDEHYPYQDETARSVALKILADFKPELLVVGSDGIDFYALSSFDKNPDRMKIGLQSDINLWKKGQREWADVGPNRSYIMGNHEDRLRRYLWNHSEIADLDAMKLENMLELSTLGINWNHQEVESGEVNILNRLVVKHGRLVRQKSGMSALAEMDLERYSISTLSGHTHRGGVTYARTRQGVVLAAEAFCLCKLDPEYVLRPNWQQGLVLAEVSEESVSFEPVPFYEVRGQKAARWRGKEYKA